MPDLGIQTIQFVIFKANVDGLTAPNLYRTFLGVEPDTSQTNRTLSPAQPFLSHASGLVGERVTVAQISPGRIDLQSSHPDRPSAGPWGWKTDEAWRLLDDLATRVVERVLPAVGKTVRLAVNLHHVRNCATLSEANATLAERIPIDQLTEATDVVLQFNRRTPPEPNGTTLNRLLRFSTSQTRELMIGADGQTNFQGPDRYLANFLIDINSVPTGAEFDPRSAGELLKDMARRARRISQVGNIHALDLDDGKGA